MEAWDYLTNGNNSLSYRLEESVSRSLCDPYVIFIFSTILSRIKKKVSPQTEQNPDIQTNEINRESRWNSYDSGHLVLSKGTCTFNGKEQFLQQFTWKQDKSESSASYHVQKKKNPSRSMTHVEAKSHKTLRSKTLLSNEDKEDQFFLNIQKTDWWGLEVAYLVPDRQLGELEFGSSASSGIADVYNPNTGGVRAETGARQELIGWPTSLDNLLSFQESPLNGLRLGCGSSHTPSRCLPFLDLVWAFSTRAGDKTSTG